MSKCDICNTSVFHTENPVIIPEPSSKIRGYLISRDPTIAFLEPLKQYKTLSNARGLLWFNAPPSWLCNNIRKFMDYEEKSPDLIKVRNFLNHECIWTHLHKCPTCRIAAKQNCRYDYHVFNFARAKLCADIWFEKEFPKDQVDNRVIVLLGRDVKRYFSQWLIQHPYIDWSRIIALPHPSGANVGTGWSWNKNSDEREFVKGEITRLLKLI